MVRLFVYLLQRYLTVPFVNHRISEDIEIRSQYCQWAAKLMRRLRQKPAVRRERLLYALDEIIERRRELPNLIFCRTFDQPLAEIARTLDPAGHARDLPDRVKRASRNEVSRKRSYQ